jgi:hypothetical protein
MRKIKHHLLHNDLAAEKLPLCGISGPSETAADYSFRATFVPDATGFYRIDWTREPSPKQLETLVEIFSRHTGRPRPSIDSLQHFGNQFAAPPTKKKLEPLRDFPFEIPETVLDHLVPTLSSALEQSAQSVGEPGDNCPGEAAVLAALKADPLLTRLEHYLIGFSTHASRVLLHHIARFLIIEAKASGVAAAVSAVTRFLRTSSFPAQEVAALDGITVSEPLKLADDAMLVPWSSAPKPASPFEKEGIRFVPPGLEAPDPSSAIVIDVSVQRFLLPQLDFNKFRLPVFTGKASEYLACLAIAGPAGPHILRHYVLLPTWVNEITGSGYGFGMSTPEISSQFPHCSFSKPDEPKLISICNVYSRAKPDVRKRLAIPIARLNRAIRRRDLVDKAIEIGIALESLLMEGKIEGEISHKMAERAALLLGTDYRSRLRIFRLVKALYELRSKGAHMGRVMKSKFDLGEEKGVHVEYVIDDGMNLIASIIQKVMELETPTNDEYWTDLLMRPQRSHTPPRA